MQIIVDRKETSWPWLAGYGTDQPVRDLVGDYAQLIKSEGKYLRDVRYTPAKAETIGDCFAVEIETAYGLDAIVDVIGEMAATFASARQLHLDAAEAIEQNIESRDQPLGIVTEFWQDLADKLAILDVLTAGEVAGWCDEWDGYAADNPPGVKELRLLTGCGDKDRLPRHLRDLAEKAAWWHEWATEQAKHLGVE